MLSCCKCVSCTFEGPGVVPEALGVGLIYDLVLFFGGFLTPVWMVVRSDYCLPFVFGAYLCCRCLLSVGSIHPVVMQVYVYLLSNSRVDLVSRCTEVLVILSRLGTAVAFLLSCISPLIVSWLQYNVHLHARLGVWNCQILQVFKRLVADCGGDGSQGQAVSGRRLWPCALTTCRLAAINHVFRGAACPGFFAWKFKSSGGGGNYNLRPFE